MVKYRYDLKVLYCEDSKDTIESLFNSLNHRFREVVVAQNGEEGLLKYKSEQPDLIITDIRMPVMDGLEMTSLIRKKDKKIKIIIISAHTDIDYFLGAIDYRVSAFIRKPVDFKIFDDQLEEIADDIMLHRRLKEEESKRLEIQREQERLYKRIKQDLSLARSVQEYLLPEWLYINDQILFTTAYLPSLEVGGDMFGYYPIGENRYIFYVGDVSGHGLKSAMLMMAAYSSINMLIEQEKPDISPARIINRLNKILSPHLFRKNNYMTLILGTIDCNTDEVCYIRAGHPEPIIFDRSIAQARLMRNGKGTIPVGWLDDYQYSADEEDHFVLKDTETVFIYSDGLFECNKPDGSRLGQEKLLQEINKKMPDTHPLTSSLEFMQYIKDMGYNLRQDDFTLTAFFKPNANTIPNLKTFYLADIPEDIDLNKIQCSEFLQKETGNSEFAEIFEKDINFLFGSTALQQENSFITGFILLLSYDNGSLESLFWLKPYSEDILMDDKKEKTCQLNEADILEKLNPLEIHKRGYLKEVNFKSLGEIIQVTCHLKAQPAQ